MATTTGSAALDTALAYHAAWTSGDLDDAMTLVADAIVCRAPDGDIDGKEAYREYLGGFVQISNGTTDIAAYGDDEHALLFYCPHTEVTTTAPAAEHLTIRNGQIVESRLVFDRLSFVPPRDVGNG